MARLLTCTGVGEMLGEGIGDAVGFTAAVGEAIGAVNCIYCPFEELVSLPVMTGPLSVAVSASDATVSFVPDAFTVTMRMVIRDNEKMKRMIRSSC